MKLVHSAVRFSKIPLRRQVLLAEASFCLFASYCALRLLPFRVIAALLDRSPAPLRNASEELIRRKVQWAIECCCRRYPRIATCFPRALAAFLMCHWRGLETTLYYGVNLGTAGAQSHVWLQYRNAGIVGHEVAGQYRAVIHFPREEKVWKPGV